MTAETSPVFDFYASTPRALEPILEAELRAFGAQDVEPGFGGVSFRGSLEVGYRLCLWSRVASRVLLALSSFETGSMEQLYDAVGAIDWSQHLTSDETILVETTVTAAAPEINSHFAALRVKDAVVDQFRSRTGARPSVAREEPDLCLHVFIDRKTTRVSLNLAGDSLHRRGYRIAGVAAPLKENLAAGLLELADFSNRWRTTPAFLDPMCGSGTFPIEAALMAADVAPGLLRGYFGFLAWRRHDAALWSHLVDEARQRDRRETAPPQIIVGYDADPRAVQAATDNARKAGLSDWVRFENRELDDWTAPDGGPGLLIANPPYGHRLGQAESLQPLYRSIGLKLKSSFPEWDVFLLSGDRSLDTAVGMRPKKRMVVFNGPIECRFLFFPILPAREARPPKVGDRDVAVEFANRLRKRYKHLSKWAMRKAVSCFRLYDADLPQYAFAADKYEDWVHVQEYEPPKSVPAHVAQMRLNAAISVMSEILGVDRSAVFVKRRQRQRGSAQYEKLAREGELREVREGGHRFLVNFTDYLDTGLFLDHRKTRAKLAELAKGRRFLNLFGYTGSAAVYAAKGGALRTVTVDMSQPYLTWAGKNFALNGLDEDENELVHADCLEWLDTAKARYGVIFLDPPTFSNSKRMQRTLDIQRDHVGLIQKTAKLLEPNGVLVFATNHRRFRLDSDGLTGLEVEEITERTLPEDFKRSRAGHRCWLIRNGE